ncbi:MAG: heme lyase CcmF/NrfE family subunit [Porticoccaceae bacterium]
MTAEFGHFALILALCLACLLALLPLLGSARGNVLWMSTARPLALGQFVFTAISFACLVSVFLGDDFSVKYVANNSHTLLPDRYKVSAVWGAHEGSLLLWVLILSGWTLAVATFSRSLPLVLVARVLAVMGMIGVGFYLFVLLTSNPFERALPFSVVEGGDLNPLLQDIGLIIHPPLLYMGYVGFSVGFAFAIAALLGGKLDAAWARWTRPWINTAWAFLTVGIALGSWWAYYELGWGGWWFWDPVENASFMPWLVGTALVHSLAATEKRGVFRSWTLLLAILAFSLSLLGTFLVRSGVLTSVHAFASDPTRGIFILGFLAVVIGGSLLLYALRSPTLKNAVNYGWRSREMFLLANNALLVVIATVILLGTLYPLLADVMDWGTVSVGPPYFNLFFAPVTLMLALLMGIAVWLQWKDTSMVRLRSAVGLPAILALAMAVLVPAYLGLGEKGFDAQNWQWSAMLAVGMATWVVAMTVRDVWHKSSSSQGRKYGFQKLRASYWGMVCAHIGVAVAIAGVGITTSYSEQRDVRLAPGEHIQVGAYEFVFDGVRNTEGPNYRAQTGTVKVNRNGHLVATLYPEKRRYLASNQVMTEAAIDGGLLRDIYVALGEALTDGDGRDGGGAWALRLYVKPLVRWIWLGALMIACGGLLAAVDKRYRRAVPGSAGVDKAADKPADAVAPIPTTDAVKV